MIINSRSMSCLKYYNMKTEKFDNQINLIDVETDIKIEKEIDLVISLKSMGYHYPFELYLKLFTRDKKMGN